MCVHLAGSAGTQAPLRGLTEHENWCAWPFAGGVQVILVAPFNVMSAFCRSSPLPFP